MLKTPVRSLLYYLGLMVQVSSSYFYRNTLVSLPKPTTIGGNDSSLDSVACGGPVLICDACVPFEDGVDGSPLVVDSQFVENSQHLGTGIDSGGAGEISTKHVYFLLFQSRQLLSAISLALERDVFVARNCTFIANAIVLGGNATSSLSGGGAVSAAFQPYTVNVRKIVATVGNFFEPFTIIDYFFC
jgi:hypothetical protein